MKPWGGTQKLGDELQEELPVGFVFDRDDGNSNDLELVVAVSITSNQQSAIDEYLQKVLSLS